MTTFAYQPVFEHGHDDTEYRKITGDGVSVVRFEGKEMLKVSAQALETLTFHGLDDISHLHRASHLQQLRKILEDPEASTNDRFVAVEMLKNACISAGRELPMCQDTGTAIVIAHKGQQVWTEGDDAETISRGVWRTWQERNLRFSQMAPLDMYTEKNTGTNLPAQIEIYADPGMEYRFLFVTKGGGSGNKTYLFQETKALLNPKSLQRFIAEKIQQIGTAACPPYHLAVVIGGLSAEHTLKTVKLASAHDLDDLPTAGNVGGRAFRDREMEALVLDLCTKTGLGAQFGGKYFAHDVRVIRLPRHGASCPVGLGVSCSADRQARGKITRDGVFLEKLETNPARFLPEVDEAELGKDVVKVDLERPMKEVLAQLSRYPVGTRLSLTGTLVVARDIAHAKLKERLDQGQDLPESFKKHPVYYAGPAKTPKGKASGSFGPTTAGRMDSYVDLFQSRGGSMIMLAKGNRSKAVTDACQKHGGFYLGSIGGPAAQLADHSIRKVEILEFPELGMEAIWRIVVEDFPAFIVVDDKGHDFYASINARRMAEIMEV